MARTPASTGAYRPATAVTSPGWNSASTAADGNRWGSRPPEARPSPATGTPATPEKSGSPAPTARNAPPPQPCAPTPSRHHRRTPGCRSTAAATPNPTVPAAHAATWTWTTRIYQPGTTRSPTTTTACRSTPITTGAPTGCRATARCAVTARRETPAYNSTTT